MDPPRSHHVYPWLVFPCSTPWLLLVSSHGPTTVLSWSHHAIAMESLWPLHINSHSIWYLHHGFHMLLPPPWSHHGLCVVEACRPDFTLGSLPSPHSLTEATSPHGTAHALHTWLRDYRTSMAGFVLLWMTSTTGPPSCRANVVRPSRSSQCT